MGGTGRVSLVQVDLQIQAEGQSTTILQGGGGATNRWYRLDRYVHPNPRVRREDRSPTTRDLCHSDGLV